MRVQTPTGPPAVISKGWPMGRGATDHFSDAVLQRGHDGAQAPQFQDHAGQFITGEAADSLEVLCFVADVVGADSRARTVHHVVVKGEKDVGRC